MRLLTLPIVEPLPGLVLPEMAETVGQVEAARRYRAIVLVTLRQLKGLENARIRLQVEPADADDAVRFWVLPKLADKWEMEGPVFRAPGWEIDFGDTGESFEIDARGYILCPWLSARWVHAGLLGLGLTAGSVIGPARGGGEYFHAFSNRNDELPPRMLPELPFIRTDADWLEALDSPLGAALKKAWEAE